MSNSKRSSTSTKPLHDDAISKLKGRLVIIRAGAFSGGGASGIDRILVLALERQKRCSVAARELFDDLELGWDVEVRIGAPRVVRALGRPDLRREHVPFQGCLEVELAARERRVQTVSGFRIFVFRSRHDLEANFFVVVPVLCVRTVVGWLPRPELFKVVAFEAALALRPLLSIRDRILVTAERTVD